MNVLSKIKWGIASELCLVCLFSHAIEVDEEKKSVCRLDDTTSILKHEANHIPNYFFRPFPNSVKVSYASGGDNYILDLNSGKEIKIPGPYDPVPTPDELFMTIPPDDGLTFYDLNKMENGNNTPILTDKGLKGVYQSVGIVEENQNGKVYRFITDQNGLSYRDYQSTKSSNGNFAVQPIGSTATVLCRGKRLSLPMLSKDGRQLAALDVDEAVTKIFDINPTDGSCTESINLGIPTGKVDFNFNNDDIAFHVLNNNLKGSEYFKVPSDSMVMNVFVYKRSTGEISRITNNTDSNSVYPAFRRDGKIVYMHHPKRRGDQQAPSSFVVADPNNSNKVPFEIVSKGTCDGIPAEHAFNSLTALGGLWGQVCSVYGNEMSAPVAALSTLSLNPKRCESLVEKYWENFREKVIKMPNFKGEKKLDPKILTQLTQEDLLQACPTKDFAPGNGGPGEDPTTPPTPGSPSPIPESCMECHEGSIPFDDIRKLKSEKAKSGKVWAEEILDRIIRPRGMKGRMPPRNELSEEEKKKLVNYLSASSSP